MNLVFQIQCTERPITITKGTNILIGTDTNKLKKEVKKILNNEAKQGICPELWDGKTAKRIIDILINKIFPQIQEETNKI